MLTNIEILALKSITGIGDQTIRKINRSSLDIPELKQLSLSQIKSIFRTENDFYSFINNFDKRYEDAENLIEKYSSENISIISCNDLSYPQNLLLLEDYPILLYCKGNINLLRSNLNIAVIGTRENSLVGQTIAKNTTTYFAKLGFTIVSGLAKGIDAIAHEAALSAGAKTIAVLVDIAKIYPKENSQLAEDIVNTNGLLLSENSPGSFQNKNAFVLRDRIQSGLSLAVFPIETDVKGGTMHTVGYAKKQGRLIFVPDLLNPALIDMYNRNSESGFAKTNGIKYLITTGDAIPFTKENYDQVYQQILNHRNKICATDNTFSNDLGLFDRKNDLNSETLIFETNRINKINDEIKHVEGIVSAQLESDEIDNNIIKLGISNKDKELLKIISETFRNQVNKVSIEEISESDLENLLAIVDKYNKDLRKILSAIKKKKSKS